MERRSRRTQNWSRIPGRSVAGSILTSEDRDECQPISSALARWSPIGRINAARMSCRGAYMVTARLPESADGQFEYRIRNLNEQHERVAKERELRGR